MTRPLVFGNLPKVPTLGGANPYPVIIVYDNRLIGRASTTVSADSTAVEGNMVAANLLTEYSFDYWRSDSVLTRSQQPTPEVAVTYSLTESAIVNWLSYHWSNILVPWRADLYRGDPAAGGVLLHTTDWMHPVVKSEVEDFGSYDEFPWILGPSNRRITGMALDRQMMSFAMLDSPVYSVDHILWRFDVAEGVNGTEDFLQVGLMFAGLAFQPQINMSTGCQLSPIDLSISRRTAANVETGIDRATDVELTFALDYLTAHEAQTVLFQQWVRDQPKSARIFVYKEPAPEDRLRFYDGGAFIGTRETFDAVTVEEEPGEMGDVYVSKTVKGITIRQTG